MKTNNFYIYLILISSIIFSCVPDEDIERDGFTFRISNSTTSVYKGEIVIGGMLNGNFIATDSVNFERNFDIGSSTLDSHFIDENRWKPNLEKIRNIPSERCYFKLKLSNGRMELVKIYNSNELLSLQMPKFSNFKGSFGDLYINIDDNQISGYVSDTIN